jgi:hypothetical protein
MKNNPHEGSEQARAELEEMRRRWKAEGSNAEAVDAVIAELEQDVAKVRAQEDEIVRNGAQIEKLTIDNALSKGLRDVGVKPQLAKAAFSLHRDKCSLVNDQVMIEGKYGRTNLVRFLQNWAREEGAEFCDRPRAAKFGQDLGHKAQQSPSTFREMIGRLK